jgi:SPP1 gp7 family putative phage head morphogenesis protein
VATPARAPASPRETRRVARERFVRARIVQQQFERQLAAVARQVGILIRGIAPDGNVQLRDMPVLRAILKKYSETLEPWAQAVVEKMQAEISQRDLKAWHGLAESVGRNLKLEIQAAPVGMKMRQMREEQIKLITSIPVEAATRVHEFSQKLLVESGRADELKREILRSGQVSASKARTIARTEVAKTASTLTQARAEHIGSTHYIWRTSMDPDVRLYHKRLEGKPIAWGDPPVVSDNGRRAHAGQDINCRCYPEPIIPDF